MSHRDDRHEEPLTEEEAMSGGIVWVCENGHVDVAHKTEGNHINLCSRCKDGVCEPRKTLGRRSKAQRQQDRELGIHEPRRRDAAGAQRREAPVTIAKPGQEPVVVDADTLRPISAPAFAVSKAQREAILAGRVPRLGFPREAPADHPEGQPYPAEVGDVVAITSNVRIVIVGRRVLVDEIVLQYEVHDARPPVGGSPIATVKAPDKPQERMGGPQFRPEREPQPLTARERHRLADSVREAELRKLTRTRDDLGHHLKEQADAPRDVRFHLRKTIEGIERRIENIHSEMSEAA